MSKNRISFKIFPNSYLVRASHDQTILEALLKEKVLIHHSCGGGGSCGTCRIVIKSGLEKLPARNEVEAEMAEERGFSESERLSCQTFAVDGLEIEIPKASQKMD